MRRYLIPILVLILLLTSGILVGCGQSQPPYFKASGEPINLVNNSRAYDHTWHEVAGFLQWDTTDEEAYTTEHMCGYFAEELHNRAEYYGFKTAFVVVEFEDGEPHALNAFNTIGFGLVYVDCTGEGRFETPKPVPVNTFIELPPVKDWDKVAYIVEGQKMGVISFGYTELDFSYEWYKQCRARLAKFERDLDNYNSDVNSYNEDVERYNEEEKQWLEEYESSWLKFFRVHSSPGDVDWSARELPEEKSLRLERQRLEEEEQRLSEEKNRLISEWATVRGYDWEESESPVTHIEIYW